MVQLFSRKYSEERAATRDQYLKRNRFGRARFSADANGVTRAIALLNGIEGFIGTARYVAQRSQFASSSGV
jgi:hypothetical protein